MIRPRISTRIAAGLLGIRIAGGDGRDARPKRFDRERPDWRQEFDAHDAHDELSLALHADLGKLLEARISGWPRMAIATAGATRTCGRRERRINADLGRRGQCPKTRR
ncbi:MAG TPA: hypothetical protein VHJ54_01330 [Solirubrobacterales bacterium]|jgi:hypothetical protein|nr:hypothetical protein [Solirubrobacterales bacterium]